MIPLRPLRGDCAPLAGTRLGGCILLLCLGMVLASASPASARDPRLFMSGFTLLEKSGFGDTDRLSRFLSGFGQAEPGLWESASLRQVERHWAKDAPAVSFRQDVRTLPFRLWRTTTRLVNTKNLALLSVAGHITEHADDDWDHNIRHEVAENPRRLGGANELLDGLGTKWMQYGATSLLYGTSLYSRNPRLHSFALDVVDILTVESTIVTSLKYSFGRHRPNGEPRGFPSGHTASSFAIASAVQENFGPWWGGVSYVTAGMVGAHRIDVRKHNLSDVMFGAALGVVIGHSVAGDGTPFGEDSELDVVPYVDAYTGTAGLGVEWQF